MDFNVTAGVATPEFTAPERAYIRKELAQFLSSFPKVSDGLLLKTWKTGPRKGEVKLNPAAESLVKRRLARVGQGEPWARLFFTEAGLRALRDMLSDPIQADPTTFAHVRSELGISSEEPS